ncbi:Dihydropyrimidinase [Hibiscus syriacus]|uniref:Dihydropyrimidinase n=1 Tax=Hibiscus syriacus TaxID=106335 RepID=A0A6A2Y4Z9_HIBSY|nr:Dihydropyrimidinase [Hibiscus syriacus]
MSSSSKLLIKGGTLVNAHNQEVADVYVEDGIILAVGPNIKVDEDVTLLDATGKYVMPGGIDPHTHLAMGFMGTETIDDFFSGQASALAGGTTMHIDFVIPVNGSLVAGINSFKFFMAFKGSLMISDELLLQGFKRCKSLGALPMVHAENGGAVFEGQSRMIDLGITGSEGHALSRPPVLEGEATARAIHLEKFVNTPLYVVHAMSIDARVVRNGGKGKEIFLIENSYWKEKTTCSNRLWITVLLGQKVVGEPVVSGLVLNNSGLWDPRLRHCSKVCQESSYQGSRT